MQTMRAVEITAFGAPEVLRLAERAMPVAGAGELLIRVSARGINRPDVLQRKGHYAARRFGFAWSGGGRRD